MSSRRWEAAPTPCQRKRHKPCGSILHSQLLPGGLQASKLEAVENKLRREAYFCEEKVNGHHVLFHLTDDKVSIWSKHGILLEWPNQLHPRGVPAFQWAQFFTPVVGQGLILDAEVVALRSNQRMLATNVSSTKFVKQLVVFDIVCHNGLLVSNLPFRERRRLLEALFGNLTLRSQQRGLPTHSAVLIPSERTFNLRDMRTHANAEHWEGLVFKRADASYCWTKSVNAMKWKDMYERDTCLIDTVITSMKLEQGIWSFGLSIQKGKDSIRIASTQLQWCGLSSQDRQQLLQHAANSDLVQKRSADYMSNSEHIQLMKLTNCETRCSSRPVVSVSFEQLKPTFKWNKYPLGCFLEHAVIREVRNDGSGAWDVKRLRRSLVWRSKLKKLESKSWSTYSMEGPTIRNYRGWEAYFASKNLTYRADSGLVLWCDDFKDTVHNEKVRKEAVENYDLTLSKTYVRIDRFIDYFKDDKSEMTPPPFYLV